MTFPSLDGVPLDAWFIPYKGSDKIVVCNHPIWFNRYGLASHLEPWKQIGGAGGNDFEVNFMPDYKHLHDAGYNVLTYDMRNFGHSGIGNGGLGSNGIFESRDVVGSLRYVKSREDTRNMTVGLFSRCCGGNATYIAMTNHPEYFRDVRCMVNPQPVSLRPFYERITEILGIEDQFDAVDREIQLITSFRIDDMSPVEYAKNCHVPTFVAQVHDDALTKPGDVQTIFDNIPTEEKKLHWIDGTTRRWDGYLFFPNNPDPLIEWFDKYMN
ncbi:alpha/beta hydrolase family protein [Streptomyces sp. NBC_00564]|uniref:alpha/beta hydrolase family protein n=1 Tax=Streptomyces sp. NBC_00564 TaxID=2903663 RepID=UPI00352E062E|nr:alpha/beta hydrolase [Streptomyces sp. NBC_00564]